MNAKPFMRTDSSETLLATPVYANVSSKKLNRFSTIEAQVAMCREKAQREGVEIDPDE